MFSDSRGQGVPDVRDWAQQLQQTPLATDLVDLSRWPAGTCAIARREKTGTSQPATRVAGRPMVMTVQDTR